MISGKSGLYLFSFLRPFHVGKDVLVCRGEEEGVLVEGDDGAHIQVLRCIEEGVLGLSLSKNIDLEQAIRTRWG